MQPLAGIRVLDFTTLLPGPLATLLLAEAGAEVIKIERPGSGDEMRLYQPRFGGSSVNFALLNRGKRSIAFDLKASGAVDRMRPLIVSADVVVEQFRPGVMERLGLGWEQLSAINPRLVYCAITGYGADGPKAQVAAHDLNYLAETGLLSLAAGADGAPVVPPALIADIGGGAYPAVINILLGLAQRSHTGRGCRLDVAMTDNLFTFAYWAIGNGFAADAWPRPGGELVTGGSPRYNIYRTADGRFLAAAPLEDRFWNNFCDGDRPRSGIPRRCRRSRGEPPRRRRKDRSRQRRGMDRPAGRQRCLLRRRRHRRRSAGRPAFRGARPVRPQARLRGSRPPGAAGADRPVFPRRGERKSLPCPRPIERLAG